MPGNCSSSDATTAPNVSPSTDALSWPPVSRRSGVGILTITLISIRPP